MSYSLTKDTPVIQLHAETHFPIKLVTTNFPIWQRQVRSTLIGLDLLGYVDGTLAALAKVVSHAINPCYANWFRQDQAIISALLGSCTDNIQPLISNVDMAREAWLNLHSSFARTSHGHVLSLKSKLAKNPWGDRSIAVYLHEMHSLANELALIQNPIPEEDLVSHILNQLGSDYDPITSAAHLRETHISFAELGNILRDYERKLKASEEASSATVLTANVTQSSMSGRSFGNSGHASSFSHDAARSPQGRHQNRNSSDFGRHPRRAFASNGACQFCAIPDHDIQVCRKLARLLRDNGMQSTTVGGSHPIGHTTLATSDGSAQWMFDSGVSHHTTPTPTSLQTFSDYGGPDEIRDTKEISAS
ncbi:unnamed protein product [Cuscuta campestris]|uniref:Retrotransposon Copia-like N-terminal domain-containing protein n=1 Tax=Cuscuta campestris TaxID=132261 RepID=A0A484MPH6_9ASTE|nr:unnamed protein product [Cuscuta campestris]